MFGYKLPKETGLSAATTMLATFPRSNILVLGPNSVQSLVPSTLISQVESLLDSHRIQDAVDLADAQRRKLPANISIDSDEVRGKLGFST